MSSCFSKEIDGKIVKIYCGQGEHLPVIYSNDYSESGEQVRRCCEELGCLPFHLVTVSKFAWNQNMSPWSSEPVVTKNDHFDGNAPLYLKWFIEKVVPYAEKTLALKNSVSYIAGYSMAGLFALWSLYETGFFSGAVCVSGSLWYPGFCEFALEHELKHTPVGIYLSVGDRESMVKNTVLQKTESAFRTLCAHYQHDNIPSVFDLNPGNHYKEMVLRMAKGYRWILSQ